MVNHLYKEIHIFIIFLIFTVVNNSYLYSQEFDDDFLLDSLIDDLFFNEEKFIDDILESSKKYNLLYTNLTLNSNTYFAGRSAGVDQINLLPQLSFFNSKGFYASISGILYGQFEPAWSYTNVSIGYSNSIGIMKFINYRLRYSRYFYTDGWDTLTNSIDVDIGIKNKKRTFGTNVAVSYLFGNDNTLQIVSKSFYNQTLLKKKKLSVKSRPQVIFLFAEKALVSKELLIADYFSMLNTQIFIPLSLFTKSWDIEIGFCANFPIAIELETDLKPTGFFRFSVGYLFDFATLKKNNK